MNDPDGHNGHDRQKDEKPDGNVIRLPSLAERRRMQRAEHAALQNAGQKSGQKPFINLPPVTKAMLLALIGVQCVTGFLIDPVARFDLYNRFGFTPAAFTGHAPFTLLTLVTPFTYMLLHGGWMHLAMNGLMLAAFGAGVERWMGGGRMLAFCVLCGLASAFAQLLLTPASADPVIGASGALSGLFSAVLVMMNQMRARAGMDAQRILPLAVLWIVITIASGMIGMPTGGNIAWATHVGGFLAGFAVLKFMRMA